tara:strand:+ start:3189 stop:3293 length:105 start_codon:yes stop_codon:yes gene_type:complete
MVKVNKKNKKTLSLWDKIERGLRRLFSKALPKKY